MILQREGGVKGRSKCIYSFSFRERKVQLSVSNDYPERTLFREGWRLCLEYPSSLFVCLFVCLSVCPPVFLETARYTLTKLCVQVTYVVRQKPIDFGVN